MVKKGITCYDMTIPCTNQLVGGALLKVYKIFSVC